jgi:signal transduction histidine kinase
MKTKLILSPESKALLSVPEKLFRAFLDQQRQATLGSFVRGIVHNMNGALQILSLQVELLQRTVAKDPEKIPATLPAKAEQCMDQINKLRRMIDFLVQKGTHEDEEEVQGIDLNQLLDEELSLLRHNLFFKHQVKVVKSLAPQLPLLQGYYLDFSQSISHLIQNALEAMEESPSKELGITTRVKKDRIFLSIRDSGCGIPEAVKPQLFKPFISTKGEKHPGLGLFVARQLLISYGASFAFSSQAGETLFEVHFPLDPGSEE